VDTPASRATSLMVTAMQFLFSSVDYLLIE